MLVREQKKERTKKKKNMMNKIDISTFGFLNLVKDEQNLYSRLANRIARRLNSSL